MAVDKIAKYCRDVIGYSCSKRTENLETRIVRYPPVEIVNFFDVVEEIVYLFARQSAVTVVSPLVQITL